MSRSLVASLMASIACAGLYALACSSTVSGTALTAPDGSANTSDAAPADAGELGRGDVLTPAERDLFDRGGDATPSLQQLAQLADSLFAFDPTIDATKSAVENASAIAQNIDANLGAVGDAGPPCGKVTIQSSTVNVDFGAPPGCTLKNGVVVSGSVQATVTKGGSTVKVALAFTSVVVNGKALSGTADFTTTSGSSFTVTAILTSDSTTYSVQTLTVAGTPGGTTTVNGSMTTGNGDVQTTISFAQVTWKLGDCYPNGGTMSVKKGLLTTVVTFTASTPTTGQVTVTVAKKSTTESLPAYGKCGTKDAGG